MDIVQTQFNVGGTLVIYFIVVNIAGFISMWYDKRLAQQNSWRVSEKTLLMIAVVGGSIGSLIGMHKFHHKTKHVKFMYGIPVIIFLQIAIIIIYKFNLYTPIIEKYF